MFSYQSETALVDDREDLIAILQMRYGQVPGEMINEIYEIGDMNTLQRLILSAANAANWDVFLEEFHNGRGSFRLVGESFNPLRDRVKGSDVIDGKEKE